MKPSDLHCLFRVEAGPGVGLGHLSRCLALALWLREGGAESGFVMTGPDKDAPARVEKEGFPVLGRQGISKPGSGQDASELAGLSRETGASWLVVDGYDFGPEFFQVLRRSAAAAILAVDDYLGAVEADLILNQNLAVDRSIYDQAGAGLLIGPDFCLLPPGFEDRKPREYPDRAGRILVTTGGGDPKQMTAPVMAALSRLPGLEVDVIQGPFNKNSYAASGKKGSRFHYHRSLPSLVPLIQKADLAVMSLGVTTWEMAALGLPFVMLPHHPAQVPTARWLEENGYATLGMEPGRFQEGRFLEAVQGLLNDRDELGRRSRALTGLVDGRGGTRVAAAMDKVRSFEP